MVDVGIDGIDMVESDSPQPLEIVLGISEELLSLTTEELYVIDGLTVFASVEETIEEVKSVTVKLDM
jgi:hypothetical protein